jgi:RNA polymerase sigma-70 factor, ECF subfamily
MKQLEISESINQWLENDDAAFEVVFHYYRPRLLMYARRYLKSENAAEDLTTEVLVKMWQNRQSITNTATFENYLFTIARNMVIKAWQKKVDSLLLLEEGGHVAEASKANDSVLYKELEQQYQQGLAVIPEQRRRIFLLHREHNLTYREIARHLNISPKTVENQIALTLKQLRLQLSHYLSSDPV